MDLLGDLNEPQRHAVTHVDGPLLVLAGAGSGKTRVITRRVAHLIGQGVAPWHILAITFTNKAAGEMRQRIEAAGATRGVTACTFHSLAARLLREFATEAELSPNFTIYDASDQARLVKTSITRAGLPSGTFTPATALGRISRAKMRLQTAEQVAAKADTTPDRLAAKVHQAYQDALKAANAVDFDDLLMKLAFLLRDRPDVRGLLSQRYRYVQIDEYQDTNHPQYIIAHGLALDHENICATGDPDQSIYSWRGADVSNILEFESDYPNARVIRLEENYRSTAPILAAATRLISHNRQRKDKALFTRKTGGDDVTVLIADDEHTEATEIVRRVKSLVDEGLQWQDIAVFYRLNSLSRVLEDAFRKGHAPYRIARGTEFYNRKEIKDSLAYLKLLVNPADSVSCERIINAPARGIGATTLKRLWAYAEAEGVSLFAAAANACRIRTLGKAAVGRVSSFVEIIRKLAPLTSGPVKTAVETVVAETGLENELRATGSDEGKELANVNELITAAAEFDAENEDAALADYLNQVALVSDIDRFEGNGGAVTLMTLHAAKGLEFPAVFMVGCEEGLLPFHRASESPDGEEEERRLCFVGVTRAQQRMCLSRAKYRSIRGARQRQAPSRFVAELKGEGVATVDLTTPVGRGGLLGGPDGQFHDAGDPAEMREQIEQITDEDFFDPDRADTELDGGGIQAGCRVRHPKFGAGRVEKVGRSGAYTRVVVEFDQFGRKTLILQYAKLDIIR